MPRNPARRDDGGGAILTVLTTEDLYVYVDGQALPEIEDAVEMLLEEDPRAARWVAAYRHQNASMHRAFGGHDEPVPQRFREMLHAAVGHD